MNHKNTISRFNFLIFMAVMVSVFFLSVTISAYLMHRFNNEVRMKDKLHIKGLSASVKGFIDQVFSLNYQLSLNPIVVDNISMSNGEWDIRSREYNRIYDVFSAPGDTTGLPLICKIQKEYEFIELIFIQDAHGDQTGRSFGRLGIRGKRWWFKAITEDENYRPFISKSYYSMTNDKPVASAFHPVFNDNVFIGVIGTDINFKKLQDVVRNYLKSKDLYAVVIDNEGVIIAHPDKGKLHELYNLKKLTRQVLVKDSTGASVQNIMGYHETVETALDWSDEVSGAVKEALRGSVGLVENIKIEGVRSTLYYEPVELPGEYDSQKEWYATLMVRDYSTLVEAKRNIFIFVVVFAVIAVIVLIALFQGEFRRVVIIPLETLISTMKNSHLIPHKDIELNSSNEFQIVAQVYNEMQDKLFQSNIELKKLNEELEQRVEIRTEELRRINDQLLNDIAEREITEKKLKESEERYRNLMQNSKVVTYIVDIDGYKPVFLQGAVESITGYRKADVVGGNPKWDEIVFREDLDKIMKQVLPRKIGPQNAEEMEYRIKHKSGETRWVRNFNQYIINENSGKLLAQGIIYDITIGKKLEAKYKQAQKMEAIATLVGGIAHQFNNALFGITGNIELIKIEYSEDDNIKRYIDPMFNSSQLMAQLTKQLLAYSRGGKYQPKVIDFCKLVKETLPLIEHTLTSDISLLTNLIKNTSNVDADVTQMQMVIISVINNAIEAIEKDGRILISVKDTSVDESMARRNLGMSAGDYVCLEIEDNGKGMSYETKTKIFEPFFTTNFQGRGLGMAAVYGIIKNHNGWIGVDSDLNKGTTVRIYLPANIS